jgi:hypothetical protein
LIMFLFISVSLFSQQSNKQLARVNKIQGVEAYFFCDPLRDYDVVFD